MGLRPPPPVLAHLRAALPRDAPPLAPTVRPARPGQEHVTLAFLGDVDDPDPVRSAVAAAAALPAPRLRLAGAGRFGGSAVWLRLDGDLGRLHALAGAVQQAVRDAGVALQAGPWRPHLTVGRSRAPVPPELSAYEGPYGLWDDLALVRSTGGRHTDLAAWRLAPA